MRRSLLGLAIIAALSAPMGCSIFTSARQPVQTDAALGKVIIYRNGVAYFERRAQFEGDQLTLTVPAARVDDFLKSLTVTDAVSGQSLPISFPTAEAGRDSVELRIQLPNDGRQDLRLSYVTESPAWKPTYRVILGDNGKGELQAWAVVDNVSGEDWRRVTVGVGSTSALSFKYDLQSVRMVERETLATEGLLASAPPTGGSPYQVASKQVLVLGNFRAEEVERMAQQQQGGVPASDEMDHAEAVVTNASRQRNAPSPQRKTADTTPRGGSGRSTTASLGAVAQLAGQLRGSPNSVRIEGYALPGDSDPGSSSLNRANVVRDQLIANGIPDTQIEVVATGEVSRGEGVRVLMKEGEQPKPAQGNTGDLINNDEPIGTALFLSGAPMSIDDGRSAMVSLLRSPTDAKQIYFFDPVSARGSQRYAFKAVRLVNPSDYTLEGGPFTVYSNGQFLGEGLSEAIPPKSEAFIPFGLDREVLVDPVVDLREEISELITIQRGVVTTESRNIRRTKLTLNNRGRKAVEVFVRHAVPEGWTLQTKDARHRRLGGAHLFNVDVPARESVQLVIEESTPLKRTIDLRSDSGVKAISLYLRSAQLDPALKAKLDEVVKLHGEIADMQERIATLESQMHVYRTRVDELNVQLVTLRRVVSAQKLSRHLAEKMEEISDRLQEATVQVSELKGTLMTHRISIQDKLAELTLAKRKDPEATAASR